MIHERDVEQRLLPALSPFLDAQERIAADDGDQKVDAGLDGVESRHHTEASSSPRGEWLEWRRGGLGASDIGALLGLSRFDSPWSLWARKVGLRQPTEATYSQQRGHDFEPVLAKLFTRETGLYVAGEQTWCANPAEPWMRCTVDGFVFESGADQATCVDCGHPWTWHLDTGCDPKRKVLGCHCSEPIMDHALGGFEAKTDGRFAWPDGVPPQYEAQAKWSMAVTGMERWWIAVLFAGWRFEVHEITRDAEDEAFMVERARAFWTDYVLTGEQPPIDDSDATRAALRDVYPKHEPGTTADVSSLAEQLTRRDAIKAQTAPLKKELEGLDNEIKAALEEAEVGLVNGVPVITYRSSPRDGYWVEPTTVRTLRPPNKKDKEHFDVRS